MKMKNYFKSRLKKNYLKETVVLIFVLYFITDVVYLIENYNWENSKRQNSAKIPRSTR